MQETALSLQRLAGRLSELGTMKTDLSQYVAAGDSALLEQQLEQLHGQWEELCVKVRAGEEKRRRNPEKEPVRVRGGAGGEGRVCDGREREGGKSCNQWLLGGDKASAPRELSMCRKEEGNYKLIFSC